jgi:hypothetical protein
MTLIDWSDRDEMLGLLVEYVADEKAESAGDEERTAFLGALARQLAAVAGHGSSAPVDQTIRMLRRIADSQPADFAGDDVLAHLQDCIEELERIRSQST